MYQHFSTLKKGCLNQDQILPKKVWDCHITRDEKSKRFTTLVNIFGSFIKKITEGMIGGGRVGHPMPPPPCRNMVIDNSSPLNSSDW